MCKKRLLLLFFAIIGAVELVLDPVGSMSANASTVLVSGYWSGNGHEYVIRLFDDGEDRTWDYSSQDVASVFGNGYSLVTITSQGENEFIKALIASTSLPIIDREFWAGGFQDPETETEPAASWVWVTGEPFLFEDWCSSEPNDAGGPGLEQHLEIDIGPCWNDLNKDLMTGRPRGYIAESLTAHQPAAVVPALSLWASLFLIFCLILLTIWFKSKPSRG